MKRLYIYEGNRNINVWNLGVYFREVFFLVGFEQNLSMDYFRTLVIYFQDLVDRGKKCCC